MYLYIQRTFRKVFQVIPLKHLTTLISFLRNCSKLSGSYANLPTNTCLEIRFSESELSSFFPEAIKLRENFSCFGLLQLARSILSSGHGLSFHFAHLTIQEFLAALHLVTLSNEEKAGVLNTHARRDRFSMVWRFVLGLGSNKEQAHKYSKTLIPLDDSLVNHLTYAIRDDDMLLAHCALESKDDVISQKIAGMINGQL